MKERIVSIQWTDEAKEGLQRLPRDIRRGILRKADDLADCTDPASAYKPLRGPLKGYRRFTHGRYRAVFEVKEDGIANGDVHWYVKIVFIAVGKRKQRDKNDIYTIAEKIVKYQILDEQVSLEDDDETKAKGDK